MTDHNPARPNRSHRELLSQLRRGARRLRDRSPLGALVTPTVSIILPVYNVEEYLPDCLDSIAAQTFGHYELIVVDDGSPDGSRAIAEEYAANDPRIKIVNRPNGGLGAARNTGLSEARGRYLTFVDSDDLLPANALELLVGSANETGSDVVVGAIRRFDSNRSWRPSWVERVHGTARPAIRIEDFLPLIRNLYTWNKLFRRDFWEQQGLRFREGVAYEDQPIITELYSRARSIDVLPDVVYHYRARDDSSSISQQTASLRDLRERIAAWQLSRQALLRDASRTVYDGWLQTLFDAHFHWYLNSPGTVDDTYWSELQAAVADFTAEAPQAVWDATSPDKRVLLELTRQDRRSDAQEFVRLDAKRADKWPATPDADGVLLRLPFLGDPALDRRLFLLRADQLTLAHSIESFQWTEGPDTGPGTASISGWAFIRKIDQAVHQSTVSIVLRQPGSGEEKVFTSREHARPAFGPPYEDSCCDYAPGTFRILVPIGPTLAGGDEGDDWDVLLRVTAAGFTVTEPVTQLVRSGSAGIIPACQLRDREQLVARWRVGEPLRLALQRVDLEVDGADLVGRTLSGTIEGPGARGVKQLSAQCDTTTARSKLVRTRDGRVSFTLELPAAPGLSVQSSVQWEVVASTKGGPPTPLALREEPKRARSGGLVVQRTRNGSLALTEWIVGVVAEQLQVTERDVLEVSGSVVGDGVTSVALATRHAKGRAYGPESAVVDGRFHAEIPLEHEVFRFGRFPLPTGDHDVSVRVQVLGEDPVEVPLKMSSALNGELPVLVATKTHEGRVVRGPQGVVRISLIRPIGDVRGRYHQHQLRSAPTAATGLVPGVLMRSYFGEHATDNGVSIQKELRRRGSDLPVYWAVQDHSVPVPDGGVPVVVNSREWYQLLSSVMFYVDNMYQPEYHQKPRGQVIVQTFHGYPFKLMGHPHWRNLHFSQARVDAYDERARAWDYLVSPAPYATPLLTRDFAYQGEVLEIGYPRNDVLLSPEADRIRWETRRSLGIADGQTAVLYAPTFRDYLAKADKRAVMADFFDFAAATRALGRDFVIMIRGHAFNARARRRAGDRPGTVDVTDYPEVSDLYLAADAAVVDYSSLRFDFGITGKPMVFHVPDLQRYKDTRGWLFDFEPTAPGPLVVSTEEVVDQLRDLEGLRSRYAEPYARFRSSYLPLEDGHAGRRFVDAVFAPRGFA